MKNQFDLLKVIEKIQAKQRANDQARIYDYVILPYADILTLQQASKPRFDCDNSDTVRFMGYKLIPLENCMILDGKET